MYVTSLHISNKTSFSAYVPMSGRYQYLIKLKKNNKLKNKVIIDYEIALSFFKYVKIY